MEENLKEACRICFKTPEKTLLDFEPYRDLVKRIAQVEPISDPSLIPNKICESCASSLISAGIFRVKCIEANARCQKLLTVEYIEEEAKLPEPPPPSQKKKRIRLCCDHCGELYDAGIVSELRAMIEETVELQVPGLAPPSSRICETCLAKYLVAATLVERLYSLSFETYTSTDCCLCGRNGARTKLAPVDWKVRYLAEKLITDTTLESETWLWICKNCASDFTVTMELLSEREVMDEVPMEENAVPFEIIFREELDDNLPVEATESLEGMPLEARLQGDDFEWPLEAEKEPFPFFVESTSKPIMTCSECNRQLFDAYEVELHKEVGHGRSCRICGQESRNYITLRAHVLGHHPHLWLHLCDYCGHRSNTQSHFNQHYQLHNTNRNVYICDLCNAKITNKSRMKQHMDRSHLGKRKFKCTYCPKVYADQTDLRRHLWTHNGQYPFRCAACAKGFSRKRFYTQHLETHE